jgi:hypothetical protein
MTVVAFVYILDRACRDPEPLARFMGHILKGSGANRYNAGLPALNQPSSCRIERLGYSERVPSAR